METLDFNDPSAVGDMAVSGFMADTVVRVAPNATLEEVAGDLVASDVGVLVVGEREVLGVVSERDVVAALAAGKRPQATRAIDVATTELAWCDVEATVAEVAIEMAERYVRHVLVEEKGRLVGIVSARDLLGAYAAADADLD